jgi:hypothetical protein
MIHILFFSRLALYLLVVALPALHPAVTVPYDRVGLTAWFVLLPVEMLVAFYLAPPRVRTRTWLLLAAAPAALFVLLLAGVELATLMYLGAALAAFLLTALVFRTGGRGQALAALEPFALAFVAYRLLNYSRASEAIARQASGVTQMLLVLVPCAFLLHGALLYLAAFRPRRGTNRRGLAELGLFLLVAVPAFLAVSFLLPPDFVSHHIVLNRPDKDIKPKRLPLDRAPCALPTATCWTRARAAAGPARATRTGATPWKACPPTSGAAPGAAATGKAGSRSSTR